MRFSTDKVYVAILTNCDSCRASLGTLAFKIAALVIGKAYQDPVAIDLPAAALTDYVGVYQLNGQASVFIRQEDDHLSVQVGGPAQMLTPLSPSEFFIKDALVRIKFVRNNGSLVTELRRGKPCTNSQMRNKVGRLLSVTLKLGDTRRARSTKRRTAD